MDFRKLFTIVVVIFTFLLISAVPSQAILLWRYHDLSNTGNGLSGAIGIAPDVKVGSDGHPRIAYAYEHGSRVDVYYKYWNGGAWTSLGSGDSGNGVSNGGVVSWVSMDIDSNDYPCIAWVGSDGSDTEIYYAYWDGSAWTSYANANTGSGISDNAVDDVEVSMVVDGNNYPHIVWTNNDGGATENIYYMYWNGTSWTTNGSAASGAGLSGGDTSDHPDIAVDSSNYAHIVFDNDDAGHIFYTYWNGSSWTSYDGANSGSGLGWYAGVCAAAALPRLDLDSNDNPHIAWQDTGCYYGQQPLKYQYWDGSTWTTKGVGLGVNGISGQYRYGECQDIVVDSSDNPHIVYKGRALGVQDRYEAHYTYWDGSQWNAIQGSMQVTGFSDTYFDDSEDINVDTDANDMPHIVWSEGNTGAEKVYYQFAIDSALMPTMSEWAIILAVVLMTLALASFTIFRRRWQL